MTGTTESDGAFQEIAIVTITKKGSTDIQFAGSIFGITPEMGEKDIDDKPMMNGGRTVMRKPEGPQIMTLKLHPLSAIVADGNDLRQFFEGDTASILNPTSVSATHTWNLYRISILFTQDPAVTTAAGTTASGYAARRETWTDLRCVGYKYQEFSPDNPLNVEVKFKGPAFDRTNSSRRTLQTTTEASGTLAALSAY